MNLSESKLSDPFQSSGSYFQQSIVDTSSSSESDHLDVVQTENPRNNELHIVKKRGRKRTKNTEEWVRNIQKTRKATGESYKSVSTGKIMPERKQVND